MLIVLPRMQLSCWVTSLEAVYQVTCSLFWSHNRLYTVLFFCFFFHISSSKHTLMCKTGGVIDTKIIFYILYDFRALSLHCFPCSSYTSHVPVSFWGSSAWFPPLIFIQIPPRSHTAWKLQSIFTYNRDKPSSPLSGSLSGCNLSSQKVLLNHYASRNSFHYSADAIGRICITVTVPGTGHAQRQR